MRLLDHVVAPRRRHDLNVLHGVEHGKFLNAYPVAPEPVGVDDLWDLILSEQLGGEGPGCPGVTVLLTEDVEDGTVLIDGPSEPMLLYTDLDAHLIQKPPRTSAGFSVTQFFGEERCEFDVPLPQSFMTDVYAALVEQLLNIPLAEWEMVVEPKGVTDDTQGKTMAVGFPISHGPPAYRL